MTVSSAARKVALVAVSATLGLTGVAVAASATGQTISSACADSKTGALRALLSGGTCGSKEQAVSFGTAGVPAVAYIDRDVTIPVAAVNFTAYRAACPSGSHILSGAIRSASQNSYYNSNEQYADENQTDSAWVFTAAHADSNDSLYQPPGIADDGVVHVRLVCQG